MPTPRADETRDEFLKRCIPFMMEEEERPQDQAIAMCISLWENKSLTKENVMLLQHKVFESKVKSFDDKNLIIEHFISTEQEDRSKDIVRADGIKFDGVPSVLKQHGFDPDIGNEPIAKPLAINVAKNEKGIKGILVKTQYYNGKGLTPPDNTGQRLYEKAKDGFMSYWSIGFGDVKEKPRAGGGMDILECTVYEYSQVGVPDNVGATTIKSIEEAEKIPDNDLYKFTMEKANPDEGGTWKFCICDECGHSEKHEAGNPCGKCPECGTQMHGANEKASKKQETISEILQNLIKEKGEKAVIDMITQPVYLKSIAEQVAEEIPWSAMQAIWFGMLDELYECDGSEKVVKAIIKELVEILSPHALAFAQATAENPDQFIKIKELITKQIYVAKKEDVAVPTPASSAGKDKPSVVLRVKTKPKYNLPFTKEEIKKGVSDAVKDEISKTVDQMKGKAD